MLNYGNKKKIIIICCLVILGIGLCIGGFFGVKAIVKKNKEKNVNKYDVTFVFIDDADQYVKGVVATIDNEQVGSSSDKGEIHLPSVAENKIVMFSVSGYDFLAGENQYKVTKDLPFYFITITRNDELEKKNEPNVFFHVVDDNNIPLSRASIYVNKKLIGATDSNGLLSIYLNASEVQYSIKHPYYKFKDETATIDAKTKNDLKIKGNFQLDSYFAEEGEILADGNPQKIPNSRLTVSYQFFNENGEQFSTYYATYYSSSTANFITKNVYKSTESISFENMTKDSLFSNFYCYLYDEKTSSWYCSDILIPTSCSGKITLHKANCVQISYFKSSSIYTSTGLYFGCGEDGIINLVLDNYSSVKFYANYLQKQYYNELITVNSSGEEEEIQPGENQELTFVLK